VNESGRTRTLYGSKAEIARQALNTPIQGSAADEVSNDIILLYEALKDFESCMVMVVHDEVLFNIKDSEAEVVYKIVHKIMNRERELNGFKFRIPIDAEVGKYWGLMEGVDLLTGEKEGGSKH
jgi:DNA polymerase-1